MPQQHLIQARLHVLNTSGGVSHFNKILMPVDLHHGIAGDPRALAKKSFLQLLHPRISLFFGNPCRAPGFSQPVRLSGALISLSEMKINTMWNVE